jgi:agmatinase
LSGEEARRIRQENLPVFFAHTMRENPDWPEQVLTRLGNPVYVSIDVDFFDPCVVPGTGTPEPGGFGWWETLAFLKRVFQSRKVVGIDVVELAPIPGQAVSEFTVARLIYKLIAYWEKWGK